MANSQKKVLVCIDWYEPGYKAGGPIRSIANFVQHFKSELDIYIFTTDRDLGDEKPYIGIDQDKWLRHDGYMIFYSSLEYRRWKNVRRLIHDLLPDTIYLNSMYSRFFTVYPLLMKKMGLIQSRVVLAPRGMLKHSALRHKSLKKNFFLFLVKHCGVMGNVCFQATDQEEIEDIQAIFGNRIDIMRGGNLPGQVKEYKEAKDKIKGHLSMLFVGRVHPIKNLHYLLECLQQCKSRITLTVAGPVEDVDYWGKCAKMISELPMHIEIVMLHDVSHNKIATLLDSNHIFVLPTAGENFGHAIFEAFASGRPVLISDQTPWRNLEKQLAGWDIPLINQSEFVSVIEKVAAMDLDELNLWCRGAWHFCKEYVGSSSIKNDIKKVFRCTYLV